MRDYRLVTLATVGWAAFGFLHPEITTAHVYWNGGGLRQSHRP
jgi:hypothetical protein